LEVLKAAGTIIQTAISLSKKAFGGREVYMPDGDWVMGLSAHVEEQ
jgi:hypothetical protein